MLKTRRNEKFKFILSVNPTKCSNTLKQFAGKFWKIAASIASKKVSLAWIGAEKQKDADFK